MITIATRTYKCLKCGTYDLEMSVKDEDIKECPYCESEVKRIFKVIPSIWNTDGAFGKSK